MFLLFACFSGLEVVSWSSTRRFPAYLSVSRCSAIFSFRSRYPTDRLKISGTYNISRAPTRLYPDASQKPITRERGSVTSRLSRSHSCRISRPSENHSPSRMARRHRHRPRHPLISRFQGRETRVSSRTSQPPRTICRDKNALTDRYGRAKYRRDSFALENRERSLSLTLLARFLLAPRVLLLVPTNKRRPHQSRWHAIVHTVFYNRRSSRRKNTHDRQRLAPERRC